MLLDGNKMHNRRCPAVVLGKLNHIDLIVSDIQKAEELS